MERAIDRLGKLLIGGHREELVGRLHRDLVFVKIMILQDLDMIERTFDQRFRAGLAIFFQQILFETAGIDADPDRAAVRLGRPHHFSHAFGRADIAGVDPKAGRAGISRLERALIVEMDIGDDRYARRAHDLLHRRRAFDIGTGNADDVDAHLLAAADLIDRRPGVGGWRIGHGLHGDRRIAPPPAHCRP